MSDKIDMKPVIKGWYSVRLKSQLTPAERDTEGLVSSFIDWVFFNGKDWEMPEYKESAYYVHNVIKLEKESNK